MKDKSSEEFPIGKTKESEAVHQTGSKEAIVRVDDDIQLIHRGVWAPHLSHGMKLPVGGSIFSDELTTFLELDLGYFDEKLQNFSLQEVNKTFEKNKLSLIDWLNKVGTNVDPYLYYVSNVVQRKMQDLLQVDSSDLQNRSEEGVRRSQMRRDAYLRKTPLLSEIVGFSECAEQSVLGQYLMQKLEMPSVYMSGIAMADARDIDESPENHSFIILEKDEQNSETAVFDISRPRSFHNVPRLLNTDVAMSADLFKDENDLLVGATEVLQQGRGWYGVGPAASGKHKIVQETD